MCSGSHSIVSFLSQPTGLGRSVSASTEFCFTAKTNVSGDPLTIQPCIVALNSTSSSENFNQIFNLSFTQDGGAQPITIFGDKCIEVTPTSTLQIATCSRSPDNQAQQWIMLESSLQWAGTDQCIEVPEGNLLNVDGGTGNANVLKVGTCETEEGKQRWMTRLAY
ncbi:hypothetical protein R3P38DRAFT_3373533 [Favolaschia claudopus]|uniref:Ricin B lectin domain-containing protein n=1 Tax=Favolaschia claudopus TaxID=2862362 RepID=A0AAV9ZSD5_9AGAR